MMKAMIMEMRMLSHKTQCVFNVRTRGGRRRGQKEGLPVLLLFVYDIIIIMIKMMISIITVIVTIMYCYYYTI